MQRHSAQTQLIDLLKKDSSDVLKYLKQLTPSGVELEIMTLANYSIDDTDKVSSTGITRVD